MGGIRTFSAFFIKVGNGGLYEWEGRFKKYGNTLIIRQEFKNALRPCLKISRPYSFGTDRSDDTSERISKIANVEVTLASDHVHSAYHDIQEIEQFKDFPPHILADMTELLSETLDLMCEAEISSEFEDYSYIVLPSISNHDQNNDFNDWTLLVTLCRDAWIVSADSNPEYAKAMLTIWANSRHPVFRRLVYFALTQKPTLVSLNTLMAWLLSDDGHWLWATSTTREIMRLIATTFTLIAVFLPTAFMGGIPGLLFKQFGVTASVAVFCSLMVARLLTPMMAAYMLKSGTAHDQKDSWIMAAYLKLMQVVLGKRWIAVVGVIAFMGLTFQVATSLPVAFLPAEDESQTGITVTTPPGSTLAQTDAIALQVSNIVKDNEHVIGIFQSTGSAASGGGFGGESAADSVTTATLTANLTHLGERRVHQTGVEIELREALKDIPGARIGVRPMVCARC